jgi:hypothetical protein
LQAAAAAARGPLLQQLLRQQAVLLLKLQQALTMCGEAPTTAAAPACTS